MNIKEKVNVDKDKLYKLAKQKDISITDLSEELGKDKTYISKNISQRDGRMPITEFKFMCRILGVKEEDLIKKEESTSNTIPQTDEYASIMRIMAHEFIQLNQKLDDLNRLLNDIKLEQKHNTKAITEMKAQQDEVANDCKIIRSKSNANTVQLEKIKESLKR